MQEYTLIIDDKGTIRWYQNGVTHRVGGPAIEFLDGTKIWCKHGEYHRIDGPAFEYAGGHKQWWVDGVQYTEEEFATRINPQVNLLLSQICDILGYQVRLSK